MATVDPERLGRAIMVRRAELRLERPALSRAANVSYPYLAEIETGHKAPALPCLERIANVLGLTVPKLLARAELLPDLSLPNDVDEAEAYEEWRPDAAEYRRQVIARGLQSR
jgi:transcriptional regulator with XRE-family HTH domain